jgi:hypothetical protein
MQVPVNLCTNMYVCRLLRIGRIRMDVTTPGVTWDLDKTCGRHPTLVCCDWNPLIQLPP